MNNLLINGAEGIVGELYTFWWTNVIKFNQNFSPIPEFYCNLKMNNYEQVWKSEKTLKFGKFLYFCPWKKGINPKI